MRLVLEVGAVNDHDWHQQAIAAARQVGAWGYKVQMYRADTLTTRTAVPYGHVREPATQHDAFSGAPDYGFWADIKDECTDMTFFTSVFDFAAVDACLRMGIGTIKIASADITHRLLIEAAAESSTHLILSTGASTLAEIERAVDWVLGVHYAPRLTLLACHLEYPTPKGAAHLARMDALRVAFPHDVGYSDHTRGVNTIRAAFSLGASMVEKHFTITPDEGGDHDFAITPDELVTWQEPFPSPQLSTMYGSSDLAPTSGELAARQRARRSPYAARHIPGGTEIDPWRDVDYLRPCIGPEPWDVPRVADHDYLPGQVIG